MLTACYFLLGPQPILWSHLILSSISVVKAFSVLQVKKIDAQSGCIVKKKIIWPDFKSKFV